ncbi:MAG TPA: hypothetical protein VIJ14_00945 [Rhabdochlamydiaceae bacterium]
MENKQEKVREILRKYLTDDCLRPQFDGMTAWELAGKIVAEFEPIGGEDDVEGVGDEREKLPMPEDDEIDAMVESESKEYMTAHG